MDTEILDKKIELIQWLSSLEDNSIIEKSIQFRKAKQKIGGQLYQVRKEILL